MLKVLRGVALAAIGLLLLCACNPVPPPPPPPPTPDQIAQADVIKALNAENSYYAAHSIYTTDVATLTAIDSTVDWSGALEFVTLQNWNPSDTVCLAEKSTSGEWWVIGAIKTSAMAGNYFTQGSINPCWGASPAAINLWGSSWNALAAQDDAAKRDLTNALNAENQYYGSHSLYSADASAMKALAPTLG